MENMTEEERLALQAAKAFFAKKWRAELVYCLREMSYPEALAPHYEGLQALRKRAWVLGGLAEQCQPRPEERW